MHILKIYYCTLLSLIYKNITKKLCFITVLEYKNTKIQKPLILIIMLLSFTIYLYSQDSSRYILWGIRKLSWLDFKEKVTYDKYPYQLAKTRWQLDIIIDDTSEFKSSSKINIRIAALFIPEHSWVRNLKPNIATVALLQHEQTHFDLVELYARKLREKLSNVKLTIKNYKKEIDKIKNKVLRKLHAAQSSYDYDVKGMVDGEEQNKWTTKTNHEIELLSNLYSTTFSINLQ